MSFWTKLGNLFRYGQFKEIDRIKIEPHGAASDYTPGILASFANAISSVNSQGSKDITVAPDPDTIQILEGNVSADVDPGEAILKSMGINPITNNAATAKLGTGMAYSDAQSAVLQSNLEKNLFDSTQSYQAQVAQAKEAGLNPYIVAGNGVGSVPSVSVGNQSVGDGLGILQFIANAVFKNKDIQLQYDLLKERQREFDASLSETKTHNAAQESLWASQVNLNADQLLTNSKEREKLDKDLREADERLEGIKTDNLIKGVKLKVDTFIQEHQQEVLDMQKRVNDAEIAYKKNKTAQEWRKLDLEKQEFNANMRLMLKRFEWDIQSDLFDKDISIEKLKNDALSLGIQLEKLELDKIKTEFGQKKALADVILKATGIAAGFMIGGTAGAAVSGASALSGNWTSTTTE